MTSTPFKLMHPLNLNILSKLAYSNMFLISTFNKIRSIFLEILCKILLIEK